MKKLLLLVCIVCWYNNTNAQCNSNLPIMENFDTNNIGVCWQVDDKDGDGFNWYWRDYGTYYGGYKCLTSRSWSSSQGDLNPDNWVYSYAIDLTSFNTNDNIELSWKVRGELNSLAHEYYAVYAATSIDPIDKTSTFKSSPVQRGEYADEVGADGVFVTRTMNISALAGNMAYIAFQHKNISGSQFIINIDDVTINTAALAVEDFNKENFKFFYNSNIETLTLKSSNKPLSSVEIYNLLGQKVVNKRLSNTTENINLSTLVDGIYIAQLEIDNTTKAIKFLKQ
ncbi:choice-of-anchor J domain-containing protein [Flavobacteriaceae bacterium LMO-SS05]